MRNAYVVKPPSPRFSREGTTVALMAFVPRKEVTQEQIDSFLRQLASDKPLEEDDGWLVFERSVIVATHDGLRKQAFRLVTDMKTHLGLEEISVH